jgi:hypothetical protein
MHVIYCTFNAGMGLSRKTMNSDFLIIRNKSEKLWM